MPSRRATKKQATTEPFFEIPINSDFPSRLQNILEQTGLSSYDILQKWILQEESLIGFFKRSKEDFSRQAEARQGTPRKQASSVGRQKKTLNTGPRYSSSDRETLVAKAARFKEDGMTLKKIAETFNEEQMPTARGKGKWYPSSIVRLLKYKEKRTERE
ncbi:MAG: recombinase family protein [Synergistaceae bacterium]|jgi:hypothetical protein|nr:recombinase family protein [Synergistaceae bacterium]